MKRQNASGAWSERARRGAWSGFFLTVAAVALTSGCREETPGAQRVEIRGFRYHPDTLTVRAGHTVNWINEDIVPHTATDGAGRWDSGSIGAGESRQYVAAERGTSAYVCTFHPGMNGVLVVR